MAPRTGLEPVTSPIISDSQPCAIIVGATRQSHSRFARSLTLFRNSLLYAFDSKKQPFRLFFLRRLPTSQRSVGMQMEINHDVAGLYLDHVVKRKDHALRDLFFLAPRTGLEPVTS